MIHESGTLLATYTTLLHWLGPWAHPTRAPGGVMRESVTVPAQERGDRPFEAWLYRPPGRPIGTYLVIPGLHPKGPADPRLDRFLRILARSGFAVLSPFLPDYTALCLGERVLGDAARAFDVLEALPGLPRVRPGVFSVSFGSLPALRLAASPTHAERVGGLVLFGGYADFDATLRFALGANGSDGPRDPLNQPVVFMNVLEHLDGAPKDPTRLRAAWHEYIARTWGIAEMKQPARHHAVAHEISAQLSDPERRLFLLGCGVVPGGADACLAALARRGEPPDFLDPRGHLDGLRCPVSVFHGSSDDVIPASQAALVAAAMPAHVRVRAYTTGLYHHTGTASLSDLAKQAGALARELGTMAAMLRAMVRAGTRRYSAT